ncbi:hypothetical protein B835_2134 [Enterococcus mundtii 3F]|nr:hypothetical protein [Enterococcus mundtii 3F]
MFFQFLWLAPYFFEEVTSVLAVYSVLDGRELVTHLFYE